MQSIPRVRCQCDAVVLIKIVIVLFSHLFYAVHAPYTVRCQCDAVVLIKIGILCAFLFSIYFITQSALTRVDVSVMRVLIKIVILLSSSIYFIMQSHAPYG
jgi:hypothetical protein